MKKEIQFLAKIDTSAFDEAIQKMQQKLRDTYRPQDNVAAQRQTAQKLDNLGLSGNLSKPTMEAYTKATQSARAEMDKLIAAEAKRMEAMGKNIGQREQMLKKLKAEQAAAVGDAEKELKVKEKIARVEENIYKQREHYKQRDQTLNQALDARERMYSGPIDRAKDLYGIARDKGVGAAATRGIGMMGGPFMAAGAIGGGIGTALETGSALYGYVGRSPFRSQIAAGEANQNLIGNTFARMQTPYGQAFMKERGAALGEAQQQEQIRRNQDKVSMAAGTANLGGAAAIAAGLAIGVLSGPVAWTIMAGLAAKGAYDFMGDERKRARTYSMFSKQGATEYQAISQRDMARDYEALQNAKEQMNPLKKLAAQGYGEHFMDYLQSQRMLGLNQGTFHGPGGFREQNINAGFTDQMGMEMANQIIGSGGSTRMGQNSAMGLKFQRGMNLTNAGQVLGGLSGSMGSPEMARSATIKILAEGMRLGLDDSKFAEENRKFTQTVADIVAQSGARAGSDVDRLSQGFGRFYSDRTTTGLQGAQTAYQQYQQISSTTSGPRGVMRMASMMSDPELKGLSTIEKQALLQIPDNELTAENPIVRALAKSSGLSIDKLIGKRQTIDQGGVNRFSQADVLAKSAKGGIQDYLKKNRKTAMSEEDWNQLPQSVQDDLNQMAVFQSVDLGNLGVKANIARARGTATGMNPISALAGQREEQAITGKIEGGAGATGKLEDQTVAGLAESSRLALESFQKFGKEMVPTVESVAAFNKEIKAATDLLSQIGSNSDRAKRLNSQIEKDVGVRPAPTQTQSGNEGH